MIFTKVICPVETNFVISEFILSLQIGFAFY